jgi:dTDP-4-amino-4,6-dideoxygalactose transaminase
MTQVERLPRDTGKLIPLVEPWFPPSYADAVRDQVLSGYLGPGRTTQEFTTALAHVVGSPRALATVSGTVALTVAAHAIGLRPGDEVLVPAYGVISTINAFASAGLRPRLVDIDRRTACLSAAGVAEALTPATRAVCFVNFSGYTGRNVADIAALCRQRGVPLVEDAAGALGHAHGGRAAGTFGDVGTYSFSVPKVLTTGQGGALVARDNATFDRAAAYIDHGDLEWRRTNLNRGIGTNLRFTDLQASLGLCQLRDLDARLERRRASYAAMRERLGATLFRVPGGEAPLHNIVLTNRPDDLVDALRQSAITAVRQYRTLSQHPAYMELAVRPFPNADYWTARAVYLPFGMAMTAADAARVADAVVGSGLPLDSLDQS